MSDWNAPEVPRAPERSGEGREWKLIEKMMLGLHAEQRKARRWGIFFKLLTFVYLFALIFMLRSPVDKEAMASSQSHVAIIDVKGMILEDEDASADNLVGSLREAFKSEKVKGIILRINSPGGSPVQAGYVYDEINRLRVTRPELKVYAVISDIGASGAYYIAAAADQIYADKASLVGSIGVVAGGFGFTDAMERLGVERRLYTAGQNKAFLDPFSPEKAEEVAFWKTVLETTHKQFIEQVRKGRGDRLSSEAEVFSGLVWSGEQALALGLIDGLGSAGHVARDVIGEERVVDYSYSPSPMQQFLRQLGVSFAGALATEVLQGSVRLR